MSEQPPGEREEAQGGVFGNLPGSRPGPRSPRRDAGKVAGAGKPRTAAGAGKAQTTAGAAKARRPGARSEAPERSRPKPEPESAGGLEEIAWAGVAAAAEAATLGIRLANRALEALRGNSEKG